MAPQLGPPYPRPKRGARVSHVHLPAPDCAPCGPEPPRLPLSCLAPPGSVFPSQLCLSKACPPSLSSFLTSNLLSSSLLLTRSVPWRASHQGNVSRGGTCSRPGDTCGLAAAQSPHTRSPSFWNLPPLPKCRGLSCPVSAPWGRPLSLALLEREVHGLPSLPPHGSGGPSCR